MSQPESFSPVLLRESAQRFLLEVVREDDGMFPYSTSVIDRRYVNRFDHPASLRYSINSLLGLHAVARYRPGETDAAVERLTARFLDRRADEVTSPADIGLLLVLLSETGLSRRRADALVSRVRGIANSAKVRKITMQDLSWMLWGACAAAQVKIDTAGATASKLAHVLLSDFVHAESGFPRHSLSAYRRDIVSFGALTYYLRSLREFVELEGSSHVEKLFLDGVRAIVAVQGPAGEWPWLLSVRRRLPLEFYPVFSVHQDSMSLLFLFPALELGLPVAPAIRRSLAWSQGANELSQPMFREDPFVAHRSIERDEALPRARRYLRSYRRSTFGLVDRPSWSGRGVRLNPECRSYHLGWFLYAWASSDAVPGAHPASEPDGSEAAARVSAGSWPFGGRGPDIPGTRVNAVRHGLRSLPELYE